MGWKIFREIARPFEQAAHGLGLSGGGVTRKILRQGTRSSRDVIDFSWKAAKNVGALTMSTGTLGFVQPKWSGTKTASRVGTVVGRTAAVVAVTYVAYPYVAAAFNAPAAVGAGAAGAGASVPMATAAPFTVETGVSYGAIGSMGSGLGAGIAPLAPTMTAAQAAAIAAASNAPVALAPVVPLGVSAPEAAAGTGMGTWVEPVTASKGFFADLGQKALTTVVTGTATTLASQLLKPNAPAPTTYGGSGKLESGPLLADSGPAGGSSDDILGRFLSGFNKTSPTVMLAIVATVLLLSYAVMAKRRGPR